MAIYKLFPEKDSTLYSQFPAQNTGLDSILEASTYFIPTNTEVSRFLVKFSQSEIEDVINNKISGSVTDATGSLLTESRAFESNLRCFIADVNGLSSDTTLEVYPVYSSWNMGTGKKSDIPKTENGCSWQFRLSSGSGDWITSGFPSNVTGSAPDNKPGGGNWYFGAGLGLDVEATQSLNYSSDKDINVNVTNAVRLFNSGTIANEGFIVKQSDNTEFDAVTSDVATIQYFSIDTNTIYPPQLEFKWRDWIYANTSSFFTPSGSAEEIASGSGSYSTIDTSSIINTSKLVATLANNGRDFRRDSIQKFYINCRPQFPTRTFETGSTYNNNFFLPTASYYAIKDLHTNEFIIDFDTNYTQISADLDGSYFKLYMNGLEPERYYQVLIKTEVEGSTLILDDNYYFKVING
jgi:hypothetical protein